MDRRALLVGAGALIAGAGVAAEARGGGQANARPNRRVDVHHHPAPPAYLAAAGVGNAQQVIGWSIQKSLDDMGAGDVAIAMLSLPSYGLWSRDVAANRRTARACNEFMARLASDHPGRFGVFATLPLSDTEGSLAEIAYALDVLRADGIGLFTSYHDRWLGDAAFDPVFEELNRRRAVVYTHPTTADCCTRIMTTLSPAMIEYGTDTTRAVASWMFGGAGNRFRDLTLIFSHAGGTMPFLIQRFEQEARVPAHAAVLPDGPLPLLRRYFYDTAQAANPVAMGALSQIVPPGQIMFGTDFPYRDAAHTVAGLAGSRFSPTELAMIYRDNAVRLFPRLAETNRGR